MFSIKTFQKDDYFTVANWTKKDPAFQKHSTWLQDAILKSLPEDYLATFKDRRKFEDNGFAMFNHLLTELTPTSLDNLILDVIELGRVCVVWALLVWPIFPAKSSPFPAKKYRPKPRPTPHFPMNPEHCPLFLSPTKIKTLSNLRPHVQFRMPNTCRSQVCLDRHWPNSTNQPAQQLLYKTSRSHRNARLVSIQPLRCSFPIH
jgi:hypothetical protein